MSSFTSPLRYADTGKRYRGRVVYRLTVAFSFDIGIAGSKLKIVVPQGFETDLASIPGWLKPWFPPDGPYAKAAVLHDWLYRTGLVERWMADAIFYDAMRNPNLPKEHRVPMYYAYPVYKAVRVFGWFIYSPLLNPGAEHLDFPKLVTHMKDFRPMGGKVCVESMKKGA